MKKSLKKIMPVCLMCIACLIAIVIGVFYFGYISRQINEDSAVHLKEIYSQVNRSFRTFAERNWGLLESWRDVLEGKTDEEQLRFIRGEKERWEINQFYFLSAHQTCKTLDGAEQTLDLSEAWDMLTTDLEPVMIGGVTAAEQTATVFAVPVKPGVYRGFPYVAIAIGYTNEELANSLNVDAFGDAAQCFVTREDGSVLFSTQSGGSVFDNYLTYLGASSDLSKEELEQIRRDWETKREGLLRCKIHGEDHVILYQPVSYHGYILLSVVPQSVVSAGFLQVQRATMLVLIFIFLLVSGTGVILVVIYNRHRSRQNEAELAYRDRMFDVLSNNVDDIFLMLDAESYELEYISPNVERLLGIPAAEVKKDLTAMARCAVDFDVTIPAEKLREIPIGGSIYQECEYLHQTTGERRWYRMTIYRMSIQGTEKYINILSDRTEEKKMTQTLNDALEAAKSANEAKSNFLSNVSHDIRTPMNAIVGFSTLLGKEAENPDKVREYTHKITASSHHLLSLINEVLDMSKIESGKTSLNAEVFSLPELLEELSIILTPQAKAKRQSFAIRAQGSLPEQLIGDKLRLNQILLNLLSNAVKYTPEEGTIEFTVSRVPATAEQLVKLRFVVRDNGIGMNQDYLAHIFTPFSREINSVTNKVQGTGLGMAITKNLIDLMGGVIRVESELNKGSVFTVDLSFTLPENETRDQWYRQQVEHILVADDEIDVCETIQEMMSDTGVQVSCVTSGSDAVEAVAAAHQSGNDFDVILLDWKMPGMDGVETARRIREKVGEDVPILVLTSYDWSEIEEEARQAGIHAFMPKPFFASTFWQTIRPLFSDPASDGEQPSSPRSGMNGCHFLIVEDNELNAEILTEMLQIEGATCELAVNGKEAVEMFEQSQPGQYDLIFMDVQMPVLNGYDATRAIRKSSHPCAKTIPIVAMTANTFSEDVRKTLDAGMDGHLGKPINMKIVRETVCRLLGRPQTEDSEE